MRGQVEPVPPGTSPPPGHWAQGNPGDAGRKLPSGTVNLPVRRAAPGAVAGMQGAKPLAKITKDSPFPGGEGGRGGWGQTVYARSEQIGDGKARALLPAPQAAGAAGDAGRSPPEITGTAEKFGAARGNAPAKSQRKGTAVPFTPPEESADCCRRPSRQRTRQSGTLCPHRSIRSSPQ